MKKSAALLFAVVLAVAVTGCEPAMKITAANDGQSDGKVACGEMTHIAGTVTPANATPKVVLQMTKAGKWVDVKGWGSYETSHVTQETLRTANVSQSTGNYSIPYFVDWYNSIRHLRVRSVGGTTSHGFYLESSGTDGDC